MIESFDVACVRFKRIPLPHAANRRFACRGSVSGRAPVRCSASGTANRGQTALAPDKSGLNCARGSRTPFALGRGIARRCKVARAPDKSGLNCARGSGRPWVIIALVAIGVGTVVDRTFAQAPPVYRSTSVTDIYGNARPTPRERRELDIYQNPAQQLALRGYQALQRRQNRRGGVMPFGLLADTYARRRAAMSTLPIFRQPLGVLPKTLTQTNERVFRAYGGFAARVGGLQRADVTEAFERRRALIAATSLNAPIHRANLSTVSAAAVIAAIERTPFVEPESPDESESPSTLDELLSRRVALSHERIESEAWSWFKDGEYRRAARAFESATLLDSEDDSSRVGELFSYVSLGAGRTAITVLTQLTERSENPFAISVDFMERFDRPERAGELRIRTQPATQDADAPPEAAALHAFVLWYLGERVEAQRVAFGLAQSHPTTQYASWPAHMRAASLADVVPSEPRD